MASPDVAPVAVQDELPGLTRPSTSTAVQDEPPALPRPEAAPAAGTPAPADSSGPASPAIDLVGRPVREMAPPPKRATSPTTSAAPEPTRSASTPGTAEESPRLRGLTDEDIEAFRRLNVEVCFRSEELGEIWLVPAKTGQDRRELVPEELALLCRVTEVLPGAHVVSLEKKPPTEKESAA